MNFVRKLELTGGAITAAIALFVGSSYIRLDQQASERLGQPFPISTVIIFSLIDLLPGLAVLLGSYLHSAKRKQLGQFLLIIGSVASVVIFLLFLFSPVPAPYGRLDLFWLSFSLPVIAILTLIVSIFVRREG